MIHVCVSAASAVRLSMTGVKGVHPAESTRLQYGLGFPMVVTVTNAVSLRQLCSEETTSLTMNEVSSLLIV